MGKISFEDKAREDLRFWAKTSNKTFEKIFKLIEQTEKNYFKGEGKPEPLKGNLKNYWSRRINDKDRLIYKIEKD
ncbi:MAG TPA: Txe/YoeB family addiction module toxin [Ignavibacteria bacterium]|nr:Txe/YoeB family addiction module toxin [Ignavibacteria bacterium]